ncbi:DeoR/GlpR family transcriptional regulator of sugar metabolism [Arthrobacter silviterrae]|uniref:DeoR/GlpR transcriptional regulator n=1 Tax=Arthrobacter silviterrae TaxID=2026658 RepID=A0ABX0D8R6_9MICC|nr:MULTISPECIES: DeoR/GlpR family DNA-binding transcription regulator [Arthrobacter]MCU6482389.1 DeoR/GlpR family DNA-binding transcription regulator [Arthrobacter sp. A2-55]MDQ0279174.1 DeoR/GlpR family transcriptional regulator of sugar metabolism [Arthrobacter silviterrae]NGN83294.1 DeoR/GlpR transcriptional regulator [Arthrobacter silviterrae]
MLAPERQARILKQLQVHEAVRVADIAAALNVSEMTIRRDIESLDANGLARKIHGGATRLARLSALEPGFLLNVDKELDAKLAIAREALELVRPGMTLALTGGTTTYQLAVHLAAALEGLGHLTVVTNSLKVAELLYHQQGRADCKVIVTGGERTPSEALVGPVARAALHTLNTDICFMGVHGLDADRGLTTPNLLESETNAAFIESTRRLVVLADSSKFHVRSLATIAPLSAVDTIITDDGAAPATRELFASRVPTFTAVAVPADTTKNQTRKSS